MRLLLLGPLQAVIEGRTVRLGPHKQRVVLAVLAARAGRVVPTAELADALWGDSPPASAAVNVRSYIHGLRRLLGRDAIRGNGRPGYALEVGDDVLDVDAFVAGARRGRNELAEGRIVEARATLRDALALWRGPAFGDYEDVGLLRDRAAHLEEQRLVALEHRIDADLAPTTGSPPTPYGDLVVELGELTAAHPYRERFHAQLMVALHRVGRQADALAAYRTVRTLLRVNLGIEPGADLRRLEASILRGGDEADMPGAAPGTGPADSRRTVPAELPIAGGGFACRDEELARLNTVAATGVAHPVVAVVGPGGVGKTALVTHWAHRTATRFPDGQLFVDLRGFHPSRSMSPDEVLVRLLRSLGVASERMPPTLDEAATLYRSLLADRRVLVILDNAVSAEQVRPLLAPAAGCMTVVTSRDGLVGLATHEHAEYLRLRPMAVGDGVRLLERVLPVDRLRAEPDAVHALVDTCGGLPLALRITAANLAINIDLTVAEHLAELRSARLSHLRNDGDESRSVRAAFDLSYAALPGPLRRLFLLLGPVPGPDVTAASAAALSGGDARQTERQLDALVQAHLVERTVRGRFMLHDLTAEYAAARAAADGGDEVAGALARWVVYYRDRATVAARLLFPQYLPLGPELPPVEDWDRTRAVDWFEAELPNLVAACEHSADHGPFADACLIADAVRGYCHAQGNTTDWATLARAAERAADRSGDVRAQAAAAISIGHRAYTMRDYPGALPHLDRALALTREAGWPEAEAGVLGSTGATYAMIGDLANCARYARAALRLNRRVGSRRGEMVALSQLGMSSLWRGRLAEAESALVDAIALATVDGATPTRVTMQSYLIELLLLTGRYDEARELIDDSIGLARETGRAMTEIQLLLHRSSWYRLTGDPANALDCARRAYAMVEESGDRLLTAAVELAFGSACVAAGRPDEAVSHHRAALRMASDIQGRYLRAEALVALAGSLHAHDDHTAWETVEAAVAEARAGGFRVLEGEALTVQAVIADATGRSAVAVAAARKAAALSRATGWTGGHDRLGRVTRQRRQEP